ncbi:acyl-CoA thioesterase [Acinetobacter sp. TTH0-4]|uniref:acyl-CoA thioesterase n=1 Tax=Acinetobacter sp. TTH0-4 TaxID=1646498 RepID=UPI00189FE6DC|nr:acyl-CoA thioesterase [Acinetobacter sp. TTH0-4]QPF37102.1 acyl-CoA thioesterase [Acinetobacter sp. TTH0-4]
MKSRISSIQTAKIVPASQWTIEQDIYLIENSALNLNELCKHLPYTEDQIRQRKQTLGLIRRERQMRPFK